MPVAYPSKLNCTKMLPLFNSLSLRDCVGIEHWNPKKYSCNSDNQQDVFHHPYRPLIKLFSTLSINNGLHKGFVTSACDHEIDLSHLYVDRHGEAPCQNAHDHCGLSAPSNCDHACGTQYHDISSGHPSDAFLS